VIGNQPDFFELGGDSLTAARVVARLRQAFPGNLAHDMLFNARTLSALAAIIVDALAADDPGDEMDHLLREIEDGTAELS
jgi:hypothetical protein